MEENHRQASSYFTLDQNTSIIRDTYLLAALLTFDPSIRYYPRRDALGKVVFEVSGTISDEMERFFAGGHAPLTTFVKNLRKLQATIFELRGTYKGKRY